MLVLLLFSMKSGRFTSMTVDGLRTGHFSLGQKRRPGPLITFECICASLPTLSNALSKRTGRFHRVGDIAAQFCADGRNKERCVSPGLQRFVPALPRTR